LNFIKSENYIIEFYKKRALLLEFIYGLVLYHVFDRYNKKYKNKKNTIVLIIFSVLGIFSFLFLVFSGIYKINISTNRSIKIGIPALILVMCMIFIENSISSKNVFIKIGQKLGDASYVMYLFHPFFIYFLQRIVFKNSVINDGSIINKLTQIIIGLMTTIICSIFIYSYVDKPVQKYFRNLLKNKK
jgi:peptidoglycan/LPS O-acetylase OafA/YrhL